MDLCGTAWTYNETQGEYVKGARTYEFGVDSVQFLLKYLLMSPDMEGC